MTKTNGALALAFLTLGAGCGSSSSPSAPEDGGGSGGGGDDGAAVSSDASSSGASSGSSGASSGGSTSSGGSSGSSGGSDASTGYDYSVYQHHKNPTRDGVYTEPTFLKTAVGTMHKTTVMGTVTTDVYAQPLYVENGPGGVPVFVLATEQNHVTCYDASTGAVVWDVGPSTIGAAATGGLAPGNGDIHPLGITGTPYIDFSSGSGVVYFDAMTTPNGNTTLKHLVYALKLADGTTVPNWPVDVSAKIGTFNSRGQNQRGALQLLKGVLYVPYGGHYGDQDTYYGWVVGIPTATPQSPTGWHTSAASGGIWASGALPTDGTSIFPTTGNTSGVGATAPWGGGEAVIRLGAGPTFSNGAADYYAPYTWRTLDATDADLGGSSAVLLELPGNAKPHLVAQAGKDSYLYVLDRTNLGGVGVMAGGPELLRKQVATGQLIGAPVAYTTSSATYVVVRVNGGSGIGCPNTGGTGNLVAVKLTAGSPLTGTVAWCATKTGLGSPMVTTTDGSANAVVWAANNSLWGWDGDSGALISGGTNTALASGIEGFNTPISARGKIVVSTSGALSVLTL